MADVKDVAGNDLDAMSGLMAGAGAALSVVAAIGNPTAANVAGAAMHVYNAVQGGLPLYVAPEARGGTAAVKLLRALRRWGAQAGADDLHLNVTTGIDLVKTDRFLRKMGFRQTGGNYVLEGVKG